MALIKSARLWRVLESGGIISNLRAAVGKCNAKDEMLDPPPPLPPLSPPVPYPLTHLHTPISKHAADLRGCGAGKHPAKYKLWRGKLDREVKFDAWNHQTDLLDCSGCTKASFSRLLGRWQAWLFKVSRA